MNKPRKGYVPHDLIPVNLLINGTPRLITFSVEELLCYWAKQLLIVDADAPVTLCTDYPEMVEWANLYASRSPENAKDHCVLGKNEDLPWCKAIKEARPSKLGQEYLAHICIYPSNIWHTQHAFCDIQSDTPKLLIILPLGNRVTRIEQDDKSIQWRVDFPKVEYFRLRGVMLSELICRPEKTRRTTWKRRLDIFGKSRKIYYNPG